MDEIKPKVDIDEKLDELIAQEEGYKLIERTPEEQEKYLKGYSLSALVFSFFYFWRMGDKPFFWLSFFSTLLFFPILFVFPYFARRRAWIYGKWHSFDQFVEVQERWDKFSVYGIVLSVFVIALLVNWEMMLIGDLISNVGLTDVNDLQQIQNELQGTLGN